MAGGTGILTLSGVQFLSNKGFSNAQSQGSQSFSAEPGFKKYLIALQRVLITTFTFENVQFSNNVGGYVLGESVMHPKLLDLSSG